MLLYIVRHGKPDYATDTLLEEGWTQARAVANRLRISGMDEIFASPMGRARETAEPLAALLNLPVQILPWAFELGDDCRTEYPDGRRKTISSLDTTYLHAPENRTLQNEEVFASLNGICDTQIAARWQMITEGLDAFLTEHGYLRNERGFYDIAPGNDRHVALFCHAGMMRVLLSHLLHIPFHMLATIALTQFTGVTLIHFDETGTETSPSMISYGDVGHLYTLGSEPQLHYSKGVRF